MGRALPYSRRVFPALVALLAGATAWAFFDGGPANGVCLAVVGAGSLSTIGFWIYRVGRTLPLVVVLASQDLLWYGLPLAVNNRTHLDGYDDADILGAALSLAIYFAALFGGYFSAVRRRRPAPPNPLVIDVFNAAGRRRITLLSLAILGGCAVGEAGMLLGWFRSILNALPNGSLNVVRTCLAAGVAGTTLFLAHERGRGRLRGARAGLFAALWAAVFFSQVASILLSSTVATAGALMLGLYLGSGRIPWKTLAAVVLTLAFFNVSKFEMRELYWEGGTRQLQTADLPSYFADWTDRSVEILAGGSADAPGVRGPERKGQSLLERVSNIQMLLYVRDRLDRSGDEPLRGETYAVVWKALVPRVLWREKPRSHIGQQILNVHFGKQTWAQTSKTFIAWGLLPEAVGNFGGIAGPGMIGLFLGACGGWVETKTAGMPLFSLTAVLTGFLLVSLIRMSGMVASVFLSSVLQLVVVLLMALLPLTRRLQTTLKPA